MPLNMLPMVIGQAIDAYVSFGRIQEYLLAEEETDTRQIDRSMTDAFKVVDACFTWETSEEPDMAEEGENGDEAEIEKDVLVDTGHPFHFNELSLTISRGELLAVVGPVGCGKSSLLSALAGEMRMTSGAVAQGGSIAYCPQYAWIQNATVRDNIVFGRKFNKQWYDSVVEACALRPDLEVLPHGDRTELGERGITVSGGQKQRLNIARAIYSNAEIVLLDDPLSAVDAHVGHHIFEEAICGLLNGKCRVLATHQLHVLSQCDRILWMQDGKISAIDTFESLMATNRDFYQMLSMTANEDKTADQGLQDEEEVKAVDERERSGESKGLLKRIDSTAQSTMDDPGLMQIEDQAKNAIKADVWMAYIKASGRVLVAPFVVIMVCLAQAAQVMGTFWLSYWTSGKFGLTQGAYVSLFLDIFLTSSVIVRDRNSGC